jgi:hypothetical protein
MAKDLDTRTLQALRTFDRLQFQERHGGVRESDYREGTSVPLAEVY